MPESIIPAALILSGFAAGLLVCEVAQKQEDGV